MTDPCPRCGQPHVTTTGTPACTAHTSSGRACRKAPVRGLAVCTTHGGSAPAARAAAARNLEAQAATQAVRTLGLPVDITPTEALLQEVQWTAGHVQWLRGKVAELDEQALAWGTTKIETEGGSSLLIGITEGSVTDVESAPSVKTVQTAAPSIWYQLYVNEREHLVAVCSAALKAGVEERRVRLAEQQGDLVAEVIRRILTALNLTPEQEALVPTIVPRELRVIAGGAA